MKKEKIYYKLKQPETLIIIVFIKTMAILGGELREQQGDRAS